MPRLLQSVLLLLLLIAIPVGQSYAQRSAPGGETPRSFVVSAASPNPFNATTQFSVSVEKAQEVTIEVYNMLGQKVQDVFQGRMSAGESRVFAIEARSLPAGLYLYRVQTAEGVVARQVTLLR